MRAEAGEVAGRVLAFDEVRDVLVLEDDAEVPFGMVEVLTVAGFRYEAGGPRGTMWARLGTGPRARTVGMNAALMRRTLTRALGGGRSITCKQRSDRAG